MVGGILGQKLRPGTTETKHRLSWIPRNNPQLGAGQKQAHQTCRLRIQMLGIVYHHRLPLLLQHGQQPRIQGQCLQRGGHKFRRVQTMRPAQRHRLLILPQKSTSTHPQGAVMATTQLFHILRSSTTLHGTQQKITQLPGETHHSQRLPLLRRPFPPAVRGMPQQ